MIDEDNVGRGEKKDHLKCLYRAVKTSIRDLRDARQQRPLRDKKNLQHID